MKGEAADVRDTGRMNIWSIKGMGGSRKQERLKVVIGKGKGVDGYESDEITLTEALAARK